MAEDMINDKVKFTKNEYVLQLIFENIRAANLLGLQGQVYEQYIALRHCFAIVKNVLNYNLLKNDFDVVGYENLYKEIITEIDKYNNVHIDSKVRAMAYNRSRGLCLEFYERLMGDLFRSGLIFQMKQGENPGHALYKGMDE